MQVFVKFEVFNTITDRQQILELRQLMGTQLRNIELSKKLKIGNIFADARGGFLLLDVQSNEEVFQLLGSVIIDHCHVETHPVITFQQLGDFFKKDAVAETILASN
ncbi:MAG: hypothetical protein HY611_06365 [Elusimicrobia bacterium]|nr:hypothetical protein [Elusimicrobiota bacterium]